MIAASGISAQKIKLYYERTISCSCQVDRKARFIRTQCDYELQQVPREGPNHTVCFEQHMCDVSGFCLVSLVGLPSEQDVMLALFVASVVRSTDFEWSCSSNHNNPLECFRSRNLHLEVVGTYAWRNHQSHKA